MNSTQSMMCPYTANGLLLTSPDTRKYTSMQHNSFMEVAISRMQGWRSSMEDDAVAMLDIPGEYSVTSYFGVFDGHGGTKVSEYVAKNLHHFIIMQPTWNRDLSDAIVNGYLEIDDAMKRVKPVMNDMSGTTAVTIFIRDDTLFCANVGDSRAIGFTNQGLITLSYDHKPNLPGEYRRIINAGGFVDAERVNGSLALSRALGDYQYKTPGLDPALMAVSPVPEVVKARIDRSWEFVVIACDGIWEVMSSYMVADFVRQKLRENVPLNYVCEDLMSRCLSPRCDGLGLGCDNMTVIIIRFLWNRY